MQNSLTSLSKQRQQLRKIMRKKRLSFSEQQQLSASQKIIQPALNLIEQHQAEHIAFYLPFNGEISPLVLLEQLQFQGKKCYLPVLHPFSPQQLLFIEYQSQQDLEQNHFGIWQPKLDVRKVLPLTKLEMIFVPLVACDKQGNRLGMGGGFYDRTLSQHPNLISIGLAHQCQQVEKLPLESWDVPLNYILLG